MFSQLAKALSKALTWVVNLFCRKRPLPDLSTVRDIVLLTSDTDWRAHPYMQIFVLTVRKTCYDYDHHHDDCERLCYLHWGMFVNDPRMRVRLDMDAYRITKGLTYDSYEVRNLEYVLSALFLWNEEEDDDNASYLLPSNSVRINILPSDPSVTEDWLEWSFYVSFCDSIAGSITFVKKSTYIIDNVTYALRQRPSGWWIY
jgi:hypothetical protein